MQTMAQPKVQVNVAREMYGLLAHYGAHAAQIATVGGFTPDAARFAHDKPITLIDGDTHAKHARGGSGRATRCGHCALNL